MLAALLFSMTAFSASAKTAPTGQVWQEHIDAWVARDLDGIAVHYDQNSLMIVNNVMFRGPQKFVKYSNISSTDSTMVQTQLTLPLLMTALFTLLGTLLLQKRKKRFTVLILSSLKTASSKFKQLLQSYMKNRLY